MEFHGITLQKRVVFIIAVAQISNLIGEFSFNLSWILLELCFSAHHAITHEMSVLKSQDKHKHVVMIYVKIVLMTLGDALVFL
jgi:hypothetical protein